MDKIETYRIWLVWTCDNMGEHHDNEYNVETVEQQLTDVPEVGTAVCPQCDEDMFLTPKVLVK